MFSANKKTLRFLSKGLIKSSEKQDRTADLRVMNPAL